MSLLKERREFSPSTGLLLATMLILKEWWLVLAVIAVTLGFSLAGQAPHPYIAALVFGDMAMLVQLMVTGSNTRHGLDCGCPQCFKKAVDANNAVLDHK